MFGPRECLAGPDGPPLCDRDSDGEVLKQVNLCPCDTSLNSLDVTEVNEAGCPV